MDPVSLNTRQAAPVLVPDQRPAADAAALAKDKTPSIPLPVAPMPASWVSQTATVIQGMMEAANTTGAKASRVEQPERVLKPFGIGMLPQGPADDQLEKKSPTEAAEMSEEGSKEDRVSSAAAFAEDRDPSELQPEIVTAEPTKGESTAESPS